MPAAESARREPPVWRMAHGASLTLDRARIVAVVNVTSDSFSDGGRFLDPIAAAARAEEAVAEGADMVDVGGESTRPGAGPVSAVEQLARVIPAVEAMRRAGVRAPISVDTTSAEVARRALEAGANAVNDQSAGRDDAAMLALAARTGAGLVLMHRARKPGEDRYADEHGSAPEYARGVVVEVREFLRERAAAAVATGVAPERIVLDPGLGFGKNVEQNLACVAGTAEFAALGFPVLVGASLKRFLGAVTNEPDPGRRVGASVAAEVAMRLGGALLFRVHHVRERRPALAVADAIVAARGA